MNFIDLCLQPRDCINIHRSLTKSYSRLCWREIYKSHIFYCRKQKPVLRGGNISHHDQYFFISRNSLAITQLKFRLLPKLSANSKSFYETLVNVKLYMTFLATDNAELLHWNAMFLNVFHATVLVLCNPCEFLPFYAVDWGERSALMIVRGEFMLWIRPRANGEYHCVLKRFTRYLLGIIFPRRR